MLTTGDILVLGIETGWHKALAWQQQPADEPTPADFAEPLPVAGERRAILWAPVGLIAGIWFYFALPVEPYVIIAIIAAAGAVLLLWRANARLPLILAAMFLLGFALAKGRAEWIATPLLTAPTGEVVVVGLVTDVNQRSPSRDDIWLAPEAIEGLTTDQMPRLLRMTSFRKLGTPAIGDRLSFKARLSPLPGPVMPGGFEYGRQLYFSGVGGTGRMTAAMTVIGHQGSPLLWLREAIGGLRSSINSRIMAALPGEEGSLAAALITGERAAVPKDTLNSLQVSGLFHILSISGLHMSLAAGGIYWFVRMVLALSPTLALRWPIKKIAAVAALAGGFIYMLLAGSGAATQRSYIMVAIMLFAILVDRPAISLRNLALAALIILVLQPESAVEASFQMSFMAVMGLAAFFEWWNGRIERDRRVNESRVSRAARWLVAATLASLLTSLIAGSLSSIPAAFHFGRLAPYGVLANGLAIPVVSFLVMPAALLALLAMPLGLERWPLEAMGYGLRQVIAISDWVAGLPGAHHVVPQIPVSAALLLAGGATLLCLGHRRWKLVGVGVALAGLAWSTQGSFPDLLVERTGANVAFRSDEGQLVFARARKSSFAAGRWLLAAGDETAFAKAAKRDGWSCDNGLCLAVVKGKRIAYMADETAPLPDCAATDLLIAAVPLRGRCKQGPTRIDRFDLWRNGAASVQITATGLDVTTAAGSSGRRPWVVIPTPRLKVTRYAQQEEHR